MKGQDRPLDPLEGQVAAVRAELSKLASRIGLLRQRTEQLSTLRDEERHTAARMAGLERALDFDRVAGHVRGAVAQAALVAEPVPHLVVSSLLPQDVYQALIETMPPLVFFDGRAERGQELRVPPRLAPTASIVAWTFLNEIVLQVLSELLVARLAEPLAAHARERFPSLPFGELGVDMTLSGARLVRRTPGYTGGGSADRPWDLLTAILHLARHQDTEEYGSRLRAKVVPFRANALLVCVGPPDAHAYASIPPGAPADTERYAYEFGIGPSKDARRTLTAASGKAT